MESYRQNNRIQVLIEDSRRIIVACYSTAKGGDPLSHGSAKGSMLFVREVKGSGFSRSSGLEHPAADHVRRVVAGMRGGTSTFFALGKSARQSGMEGNSVL